MRWPRVASQIKRGQKLQVVWAWVARHRSLSERAADELVRHDLDEGLGQAVLFGRVEAELVQNPGSDLARFHVGWSRREIPKIRDDVHARVGAAHGATGAAGEAQATPPGAAGSATGTVGPRAFALAVIVQFVCIDDREGVLPAWVWDAWRVVQMW